MRVLAIIALPACASQMVRAPKVIPPTGIVECTDSTERATTALLVSGALGAALALAASDMAWTIDHGGVVWLPLLGIGAMSSIMSAGDVLVLADQCKDAKRRGAALQVALRRREARANAQLQAVALWKLAAAEARADQCGRVRERGARIRELDDEFHAVVYMRDVAIARCEHP